MWLDNRLGYARRLNVARLGIVSRSCGLAVPIHAAGIWCCIHVRRWIRSAMETHMLSSLCMGKLWTS